MFHYEKKVLFLVNKDDLDTALCAWAKKAFGDENAVASITRENNFFDPNESENAVVYVSTSKSLDVSAVWEIYQKAGDDPSRDIAAANNELSEVTGMDLPKSVSIALLQKLVGDALGFEVKSVRIPSNTALMDAENIEFIGKE